MSVSAQECPLCSGTGWREDEAGAAVVPCECRARSRVERATAAARIPPRYLPCAFTNFDCYPERGGTRNDSLWRALRECEEYRQAYPLVDGKGLLFLGDPGVGKTHLAVALLKGLIEKGAEGLFTDYQELLKRIQGSYDRTAHTAERTVIAPILETEVVVIDDLGANRITGWVEDTINYILNYRYNEKKPTLLTSNLSEHLSTGSAGSRTTQPNFEERLGPRVASRLHEMCRLVRVVADDYRKRTR